MWAGRHARALAKEGWSVEAFDLSEASIHEARAMETSNIAYHCLDLRDLLSQTKWHASFDLVTNFFTSLGYFDEEAEHESGGERLRHRIEARGQIACGFSECPAS